MEPDVIDSASAISLLEGAGIFSPLRSLTLLKGGANNRVFKIELENSPPVVLKHYFSHPEDQRPRLKAEYEFLSYAWDQGIRSIPKPIAQDPSQNKALYSYIEGKLGSPLNANAQFIEAASSFLIQLNLNRSKGKHLLKASEACFQIEDFISSVETRLQRLTISQDPSLLTFLNQELLPKWIEIKAAIQNPKNRGVFWGPQSECKAAIQNPKNRGVFWGPRSECKAALHCLQPSEEDYVITPSDYGLHNTLITSSEIPYFIDFEYAGWDDPAKTICDFFLQPKIPIPFSQFDLFAKPIANLTRNREKTLERTHLMLPLCQIKWCCIMLNVFSKTGRSRRDFAKSEQVALQQQQIELARTYLERKFT